MDLHVLGIDLEQKRIWVRAQDASGQKTAELIGPAYERVISAAQPFLNWAHGQLPASARTPRDATLLAFEADALSRSLQLWYLAERANVAEAPSAVSPVRSLCSGDYNAQHILLREAARTALRELRPRLIEPADLPFDARWEYCYQQGGDGWDLGRVPPPLVRGLNHPSWRLQKGERALVIGCGRGHEALLLGHAAQKNAAQVVAIDIAPTAVRITKQRAAADGLGAVLTAHATDLFDREDSVLQAGAYDLLVEHTCYCAISPTRRDEYAAAVARLLKPDGRLIGLFYCHDYPDGPPYGSTVDEIRDRLSSDFVLEHEEVPSDSILSRAGQEWLIVAQRKARHME